MKIVFVYGDYPFRQKQAIEMAADYYIEHHFNSGPKNADYARVVLSHNATSQALDLANLYISHFKEEFPDIPLFEGVRPGIAKVSYREQGDFNLRFLTIPGMLLEPMFLSRDDHVRILLSEDGIIRLAKCLAKTLQDVINKDTLVAFSVGHKYQRRKPTDRGAPVRGYPEFFEADLAEWVLWETKQIIEKNN